MEIRHRIEIDAPKDAVYDAIATVDGVSGWWDSTADGDANVGGTLRFRFGRPEPVAEMKVVEAVPGEQVRWSCVTGPEDWLGTSISFKLVPSEDQTALLFCHSDERPATEFMDHCSTKWATFLLGLKASFEGGRAIPSPHDTPISRLG